MKRAAVAAVMLLAGCAEPAADLQAADAGPTEGSGTDGAFGGEAVFPALVFRSYRVLPVLLGESDGFNLDGRMSSGSDREGCLKEDSKAPNGTGGIDNAVGGFWSAFYEAFGSSLESIFREAASRGGEIPLLVLPPQGGARFGTARLDGAQVELSGLLSGYQTFDLEVIGEWMPASIGNTQLSFGPGDVDVTVEVFSVSFVLPIERLQGELRRDARGVWVGKVGGSFAVDAVPEVFANIVCFGASESLLPTIVEAADMTGPDGACSRISFAAAVEAVESFAVWPTAP
jgi:hypothetical protein